MPLPAPVSPAWRLNGLVISGSRGDCVYPNGVGAHSKQKPPVFKRRLLSRQHLEALGQGAVGCIARIGERPFLKNLQNMKQYTWS